MVAIELRGRITEEGTLDVQLPVGLPAGEVTIRIEVLPSDWEHQPWTREELQDLMTPQPQTGAEIAAWLKANPPSDPAWGGITSDEEVAEYVRNMREHPRVGWGDSE